MKVSKKTRWAMPALVFVLLLTAGLVLVGCDSDGDSGGSGGTDGSNPGGSGPGGTSSGSILSGMYYSEQDYDSQITFGNDGYCTWVTPYTNDAYKYTVGGNRVMMEVGGIMITYFYIYDSNTLMLGDNFNLSSILYLKDGSSYPVSGTYRNSNTDTYWIFDDDGFCTLTLSTNMDKDRLWSYTINGRIIKAIYLPYNSPSDNATFTTIDSNILKMQQTGYIFMKN